MQGRKGMAVLSYFGLLVLIPIFLAKEDALARYHANQGLVLFITDIIAGVVCGLLVYIPVVGEIIASLISIVLFVFMILGIVNAATGKMKPLPIIGGIEIIK